MNKKLTISIFGSMLIVFVHSANAELFVNPITKNNVDASEVTFHFGTSDVDYENDGATGDIERTFFGATMSFGSSDSLDIFGTVSYILEAELEGVQDDDTGFILGGGVRGKIPNARGLNLHGYGQLLFIDEDYTSNFSGEETSLMIGVAASKKIEQHFVAYGAVELNLYSDLEFENNADADRDDIFGFRVGGNYDAGNFLLNFNLSLMHESGLFFSITNPF